MIHGQAHIPSGWTEATIGDIADIVRGITFPASAKLDAPNDDSIVCLRTANVQETLQMDDVLNVPSSYLKRDDQWLRPGDVVISMANSLELVGKVAYANTVPPRTAVGGFIAILRSRGIDSKFLFYLLRSADVRQQIRDTASHTVNISNISLRGLKPIEVCIAPLAEQRRIVGVLDAQMSKLDAAVTGLERAQANLKRYRASVLQSAVEGRLVPTEAELAREEGRGYEPAEVLLDRILTERRNRWEEAELEHLNAKGKPPSNDKWRSKYKEPVAPAVRDLPELPEGWCWSTVDQLTAGDRTCAYGVLVPGPDKPGGVQLVRVGDINGGKVACDGLKQIDRVVADKFRKTYLRGGEVLLTLVGTIGRTAVVPGSLAGANVARAVGVLPASEFVSAKWVDVWFRSPIQNQTLAAKAHEVARKTLNLEDVRSACVALPPLAEQVRIQLGVEECDSVAEAIEAQTNSAHRRCDRLRQSILGWAFAGKLVDQNPEDESAGVLIERVRKDRDEKGTSTSKGKRR